MESAMDLTTGADVLIVPDLDEQSFTDLFGAATPESDKPASPTKQADD